MAEGDGFNWKLVFAIVAAALGSGFQHGYHTGVINIPADVLMDWENCTYEKRTDDYMSGTTQSVIWGVTTSIMNLGGTIGGVLTNVVATKMGPKRGLIYNNVILVVATVLMGLAKFAGSFEMMISGRFVIGINCGLNAGLCPMYLSEISPVALRGAIGSVYQLVITISILIAQLVGLKYLFGTDTLWPILFILPIVFGLYQVVTMWFCPDSPRYLIGIKNDPDKAEAALKFLRKRDDVADEMKDLKAEDAANKAAPKVTYMEMFKTRHLRNPLIIAVMLMITQQFSGINIVMFYSTSTFKSTGMSDDGAKFATLGIGAVNVAMTVVSLFLVDLVGRKILLLVGLFGMAIDTLLLAIAIKFSDEADFLPYLCIILTCIFIILFAAGLGSIPWFLVTEIFDQNARPKAVSLAVPANWIANFIVTLIFPPLEGAIGPWVFLIFVGLDVLFGVYIMFMVPETKNRPIEDIISQWKE